jgi:glyoxylase-like metal-dependent hydrolase (beta-lactamase superfamily II)
LGVEPYTTTADTTFTDLLQFEWCGHRVAITEAPGHTPGSVLIDVDERWLFTGDSWIPGKPTITRLPGGSSARYEAVAKPQLEALLGRRTVLPGHHDPIHAPGLAAG